MSTRIFLYIFGFLFLQLILMFSIYVIFLFVQYEDSVITSGEAYGFTIGDSKDEVYLNAYGKITSLGAGHTRLFIRREANLNSSHEYALKPETNFMVETKLYSEAFDSFSKNDQWKIYINASYFNFIELDFEDGELMRISRHRKGFELP